MKLQYIDENDRCYGITGMAIGVTIFDADEIVSAISLDAESGEAIEFSPVYYFNGNPRLSAKSSWNHILKHFEVSMGLLLVNVLCRSHVLNNSSVDDDTRRQLLELVEEEGRETCQLEDDEIENMFNRHYNYLYRVFNHAGVQRVAHDFADTLKQCRTMSRGEMIEKLRALQMY